MCNGKVTFKHLEGIKNKVADSLSRMEFKEPSEHQVIVNIIANQTDKFIRNGWKSNHINIKSNVEESEIHKQLEILHQKTHSGFEKMKKTADQYGIEHKYRSKLINNIINACEVCRNEVKVMPSTYIGKTETPKYEMQSISIDHMHLPISGNDNRYVLSIQDKFSKFIILIPLRTKNIQTSIEYLDIICNIFQSIRKIFCDNAFNTHKMKEWADKKSIELHFNASHASYQNEVERTHATIRRRLKQFSDENPDDDDDDWEDKLGDIIGSLNNCAHLATGKIPHDIVFNKRYNLLTNDLEILETNLKKERDEAFKNIEDLKNRRLKFPKVHDLEIGEIVDLKFNGLSKECREVQIIDDNGATTLVAYPNGLIMKVSKRDLFKKQPRIIDDNSLQEMSEIDKCEIVE